MNDWARVCFENENVECTHAQPQHQHQSISDEKCRFRCRRQTPNTPLPCRCCLCGRVARHEMLTPSTATCRCCLYAAGSGAASPATLALPLFFMMPMTPPAHAAQVRMTRPSMALSEASGGLVVMWEPYQPPRKLSLLLLAVRK